MTASHIVLKVVAVVAVVAVDVVVIPIVIGAVISGTRGPLEKSFPARDAASNAVGSEFQSVRIGSANFGGCVHLAPDGRCLHPRPARLLRWFRARAVSTPWEQFEGQEPSRSEGRTTARVGTIRLTVLAWAMELVCPRG